MLFPAFWFDMNMRISKSSAKLLNIIRNLEMYCHIFGGSIITLTLILCLWQPLKRIWNKRYHMEINTMVDDEDGNDNQDNDNKCSDVKAKEALYSLPPNFPSLLYISHPRRSLPVVISHLNEDEVLSSCLEDDRRQNMEQELESISARCNIKS